MEVLKPLVTEVIGIYSIIVFANVILSWIVNLSGNATVRQLYWFTNRLVDPVLDPIRRVLRPMTGGLGIDISPLILLIFLRILQSMLKATF
jgi:YggT family protein